MAISTSSTFGMAHSVAHQIADIMCHLKLSIGAGPFRMHHSLGDPFPVKVGKKIDQMEVLKQQRAILAEALR